LTLEINKSMKISKLVIKNFKSYENIAFENSNKLGDVNLFIGANASGKSNLVQVFELLKSIKKDGINKAVMQFGGISKIKNFNIDNNIISIEIELDVNEKITYKEFAENKIVKQKTKISYILNLIYDPRPPSKFNTYEKILFHEVYVLENNENEKIKDLSSELIYGIENTYGKFKLETNEDKVIKYFVPEEFDLMIVSPYPMSFIEELNSNYKNKSVLEYPGVFIPSNIFDFGIYDIEPKKVKKSWEDGYAHFLEKNAENLTLIINQIQNDENKENFEQFIADVERILTFVEKIRVDSSNEKLTVKVKEKHNNIETDSQLLSDGTISIIALIVALFYQNNDIILIEEPEHGVHPAILDILVSMFYEVAEYQNKQLIITTHSPELLRNLNNKLDDLFLIRKESNFSEVIKPNQQKMVKAFLQKNLGVDTLFIQNLLND